MPGGQGLRRNRVLLHREKMRHNGDLRREVGLGPGVQVRPAVQELVLRPGLKVRAAAVFGEGNVHLRSVGRGVEQEAENNRWLLHHHSASSPGFSGHCLHLLLQSQTQQAEV